LKSSRNKQLIIPALLAALVGLTWAFPRFWYRSENAGPKHWLAERTEVPGWKYRPVPVDESAEKVLVADRMVNGIFTNSTGSQVYVFSAKRFEEKANEIGLFIHTPDRCWVQIGWRLDPKTAPDYKEITLHGANVQVERRIFEYRGRRELVYFFGLQAGAPLPYRLDHYLNGALRAGGRKTERTRVQATDLHFWRRLWDSFRGRQEFRGPKQFVRISTNVSADGESAADARLEGFLQQWLTPSDFNEEKKQWQIAAAKTTERTAE
jgi:hypothetical protein